MKNLVLCLIILTLLNTFSGEAKAVLLGIAGGGITNELLAIDLQTGGFDVIGNLGTSSTLFSSGLAYDSQIGVLFGIEDVDPSNNADQGLFQINMLTGVASAVSGSFGTAELPASFGGLAYDSVGNRLFTNTANNLYTVDPISGLATLVGSLGLDFTSSPRALTYDPFTDTLLMLTTGASCECLFTVDKTTGQSTLLGSSRNPDTSGTVQSIEFDPVNNRLIGVLLATEGRQIISIGQSLTETTTLSVFSNKPPGNGIFALAFAPDLPSSTPVPEPDTLILMGSGLVGMFAFRRVYRQET